MSVQRSVALLAAVAVVAPATASRAAKHASCASRGSETLRMTAAVRVSRRPAAARTGRTYVACHRATGRRRVLAREAYGTRFRFVGVSVRGTVVKLRYRLDTGGSCTHQLDVATGERDIQCVG